MQTSPAAIEDRKPDLADLCLVRMSELYPRHAVITVDENDFQGLPAEQTGSYSDHLSPTCITLHHIKFPQFMYRLCTKVAGLERLTSLDQRS